MSTLLIEGGHRLEGRVAVEGNKNAALPLLAACLLTEDECVLTNVPRIGDVEVMARLLLDLGAEVDGIGTTTLRVRAKQITTHAPDRSLVGRLRGSVLLLGPLLARTGRAHIAPPGGDFPARRTISTHLEALQAMGARIVSDDDHFLETSQRLTGASMYLYEASVTGTETALLAAASASGTTEIRHAATEPHVVELCEFLGEDGRRRQRASAAPRFASKVFRVFTAPSIGLAAITSKRAAGRSSRPSPPVSSGSKARAKKTSRWLPRSSSG